MPALFGNTSESRPATVGRSTCWARMAAVSREIVIDRRPAAVFGSFRSHSPDSSRMSCSVTRTLPRLRSTLARRRPTNSDHGMPLSTAR
ncbi:MAG: hypothetical protein CYG61_00025 [Actinobacteria bacterium]|nr:MAG: hypothetical protein CYG61_00025 [Actinomycetota bacterium]